MQTFTFQNRTKINFGKGQIAALDAQVPRNARALTTLGEHGDVTPEVSRKLYHVAV
ncbi:MAG: hypothetical protein QOC89_2135 [Paraburkholderia sp.]|jgi:alcohol dehydrogenase YqhD (iron-dependent ADH family)|uniref:hypothetical protein n=1 Tax=Paraburkholderia sp. TaxID=1926495 RepID=UPI002AFE9D31|nr:hypothetical protein [Paraburkholderia sp.]MEA3084438.1 hypothetical protein [Paraburkholderia sp.]MEA3131660.1 hypothetical protein [Paraburkholderia sp.]